MSSAVMRPVLPATLLLLLSVPATVWAAKPVACTGRYGLDRSVITGGPATEVLEVAPRQVSLTSCGTTRARVKAGKRATRVKAVFRACPGVTGKAKLTASMPAPDCQTVQGRFRAKRSRIATGFAGATGGTLGGRLVPPSGALSDADTADPAMQGDNDTFDSPQVLPLVVTVGGAAGPGDGFLDTTSGNHRFSDIYRLDLDGHPAVITLNIANPEVADLDLVLFDSAGNAVASSIGTENVERVTTTTETGAFFLVVATYLPTSSGTTAYVLTAGQGTGAGTAAAQGADDGADFVPGELVVRMRDTLPAVATARVALATDDAALVSGDPRGPGGGLFRLSPSARSAGDLREATLAAAAALAARPDVVWAQPNWLRRPSLVPDDEFYGLQWHYPLISLPAAWEVTRGSPDVTVAVIDTGLVVGHPDIDSGRLVPGYDFIADAGRARDGDGIDGDPFDVGDRAAGSSSSFHGTHVAGTVGATTNNGIGVAGVDWAGKIMPIRVLGVNGGADFDIAQGILFAAGLPNDSGTVPARRADVINMSLGGPGVSPAMGEAVRAARAAGVIVVVAAGNDNQDAAGFVPASFPEVVCVSSVDQRIEKAPYSNFGATVDVAAPGGDTSADRDGNGYADGVLSTLADDSGGGYRPTLKFYQGTSMASPHVAGVAALMQAAFMAANGGARMTPDLFDTLLANGDLTVAIGPDNFSGRGLIDAAKAVAAAGGPPPTGSPALAAVPASVHLAADVASAQVVLRNAGAGELQITGVVVAADAPWLTASPAAALPAVVSSAAPLPLQLAANRPGLTPGTYTGSVAVTSSAGDLTILVTLEVTASGVAGAGDVGHAFVLLVDPSSRNTVAQAEASASSGYGIDFGGPVPGGSYLLIAGTDRDDDGFVGDPGEALGVYPTIDSPEAVSVPFGGQLSVELPVLEQVSISPGSAGSGARQAGEGYRRLR